MGRSPGRGHGSPLQYSCLKDPVDRGIWWATVHRSQRAGHDQRNWAGKEERLGHGEHCILTWVDENGLWQLCLFVMIVCLFEESET